MDIIARIRTEALRLGFSSIGFTEARVGIRDALAGVRRGLFVEGAPGTGKTHLAIALCAEADRLGRRAVYLPLRGIAGRLGEAAQGLDTHDLVAIDDVDAVVGDRDAEVALFDLHNRLHDAGRDDDAARKLALRLSCSTSRAACAASRGL